MGDSTIKNGSIVKYTLYANRNVEVMQNNALTNNIRLIFNNAFSNTLGIIKKLSAKKYLNIKTGEVKEYKKDSKSRLDNIDNIDRSLRNLRKIIKNNVVDYSKVHWITLTYAENMKDINQVYKDFEKFIKRFRYKYSDYKIEYIAVVEPQARGAWHLHCFFIYDKKRPYIPNKDFTAIWGLGFTKITSVPKDIDISLYFSAYLCDLEYKGQPLTANEKIKKASNKKAYIKGGRLKLYPKGTRLYRVSKGIKQPDSFFGMYKKEKLIDLQYSKKIVVRKVRDSFLYEDVIRYEYYNDYID